MNLQECLEFANNHPVCFLATVDNQTPHVRAFLYWFGDETGFYFETFTPKAVFEQLKKNPSVEVCFFNQGDLETVKTLRIAGKTEILDDIELKKKLLDDMPFLKPIGSRPEDPIYQIFRIPHGEAHFRTMADMLKESELERLKF